MSIASIASASSILSFQDLAAPAAPKASVTTLVSQLEKSISSGNLDTTQTILQSIKALPPPPPGTGTSDPLSAFLNSVGTAVKDKSTSEAETALNTYQAAIAGPPKPSAATNAENLAIGTQLMEDKVTLNLVKMTIDPQSGASATSSSSASTTGSSTDSTGTTGSSTLSTSSLTADGYTTGSLFSAAA
jgi:hypothetical protein